LLDGARPEWHVAEKRLRNGMRDMKHVQGCNEHWQEWFDVAIGFVQWWRRKYEALKSPELQKELVHDAKNKYGSTYCSYCLEAGLPGGDN